VNLRGWFASGITQRLACLACLGTAWLCVVTTPAWAGTILITQCNDTFINSFFPGNNNGGDSTFFTGVDSSNGTMRALIRCPLPSSSLNVRVTPTVVTLTLTTVGLDSSGTIPSAATEFLYPVLQAWGEGNKTGTTDATLTEGQACGIGEATWNSP